MTGIHKRIYRPALTNRLIKRRQRWGIVLISKTPLLLGAGWIVPSVSALPECVDRWPANYPTRRLAAAAAKVLRRGSAKYSPHWRFRAVKLEVTVRVIA